MFDRAKALTSKIQKHVSRYGHIYNATLQKVNLTSVVFAGQCANGRKWTKRVRFDELDTMTLALIAGHAMSNPTFDRYANQEIADRR